VNDSTHRMGEQNDIDEQELRRRYYERLSDWSELDAVKFNRGGKLISPEQIVVDELQATVEPAAKLVLGLEATQ
jgi:hypothetical protein